jgi:hypothetical protein
MTPLPEQSSDVAVPRDIAELTIALAERVAKKNGDPVMTEDTDIVSRLVFAIGYLSGTAQGWRR